MYNRTLTNGSKVAGWIRIGFGWLGRNLWQVLTLACVPIAFIFGILLGLMERTND